MGDVSPVNMSNSKSSHYYSSKKKKIWGGVFGLRIFFFQTIFIQKHLINIIKVFINHILITKYPKIT